MSGRPRLVVLSAVFPFPRLSGQQQRVYHKLEAFSERFRITFLGLDSGRIDASDRQRLGRLCERVVLLPSRYSAGPVRRLVHRALGLIYSARTGLKLSNYVVGRVELTPERVAAALPDLRYDLAVFEYWHAVRATAVFSRAGTTTVLDMHDVLWRSLERQLSASHLPRALARRRVEAYRRREEDAWRSFDALIAINAAERDYVNGVVPGETPVLFTPMGTDLTDWPYSWRPRTPPRLAYYGGLGNPQRQADALTCYRAVMPLVWKHLPAAELWLVGADPPPRLIALGEEDSRVVVTGTLPRVQETLATASLLLCPWQGTFGFRSRLVEAMALGVPVIASPDAAWGMELEHGRGIFLEPSPAAMAETAVDLLASPDRAHRQSRLARAEVEARFSFDATYASLARELEELGRRYRMSPSAGAVEGGP